MENTQSIVKKQRTTPSKCSLTFSASNLVHSEPTSPSSLSNGSAQSPRSTVEEYANRSSDNSKPPVNNLNAPNHIEVSNDNQKDSSDQHAANRSSPICDSTDRTIRSHDSVNYCAKLFEYLSRTAEVHKTDTNSSPGFNEMSTFFKHLDPATAMQALSTAYAAGLFRPPIPNCEQGGFFSRSNSSASASPSARSKEPEMHLKTNGFQPHTIEAHPNSQNLLSHPSLRMQTTTGSSNFRPTLSSEMFRQNLAPLPPNTITERMDCWPAQLQRATYGNHVDPQLLALCNGAGYAFELSGTSRRKNATRETTSMLKAWLNEHRKNPYPTKGEKIMLAIVTKMSLTQVSTWFANARRRLKKENKMTWTARNIVSTLENGNGSDAELQDEDGMNDDNDDEEEDDIPGRVESNHDSYKRIGEFMNRNVTLGKRQAQEMFNRCQFSPDELVQQSKKNRFVSMSTEFRTNPAESVPKKLVDNHLQTKSSPEIASNESARNKIWSLVKLAGGSADEIQSAEINTDSGDVHKNSPNWLKLFAQLQSINRQTVGINSKTTSTPSANAPTFHEVGTKSIHGDRFLPPSVPPPASLAAFYYQLQKHQSHQSSITNPLVKNNSNSIGEYKLGKIPENLNILNLSSNWLSHSIGSVPQTSSYKYPFWPQMPTHPVNSNATI